MATNQYMSSTKSSFFSVDDDDIDDEDFLKISRNQQGSSNGNQLYNNMESQKAALIEKKKDIENQSVASSERALRMLRESEEVGIATADELYHQREQLERTERRLDDINTTLKYSQKHIQGIKEQLERTERRLDDINTTLKYSQKHIQGIKSVFGGIKNFLSKSKAEPPIGGTSSKPELAVPESSTKKQLQDAISTAKNSETGYEHPALRLRNIDDPSAAKSQSAEDMDSQAILDKNLDEMMGGLSRLKGLALGLGEELEGQNHLVENIIGKSERADMNIQRQNKDMNRLLKK